MVEMSFLRRELITYSDGVVRSVIQRTLRADEPVEVVWTSA